MYVYEHVLAYHYGWSLEEIRNLDIQDFYIHLRICLAREGSNMEYQAKLAGATGESGGTPPEGEKVVTGTQKMRSGAVKQTERESHRLRKEVGSMRIDKNTGRVISFDQPDLNE